MGSKKKEASEKSEKEVERIMKGQVKLIDEIGDDDSKYIPCECCPKCDAPREMLEKFDELEDGMGADGMTDGQHAEYLAGNWGDIQCLKCGHRWSYD